MTPRWKKATYTTLVGLGLFAGAAGIAGAATGGTSPPATTSVAGATPSYTSSITTPDTAGEQDAANEASALAKLATITPDQASASAQAAVPGTVMRVELDNENGSVVYSVEIQTAAGVIDVKVDAGNGKVLAQEADGAEQGADTAEAANEIEHAD